MGRKNLDMIARHSPDGHVRPLAFIWDDGNKYTVDTVMDIRKAASLKAGGFGLRFHCRIHGKEKYLFYDSDVWFMDV